MKKILIVLFLTVFGFSIYANTYPIKKNTYPIVTYRSGRQTEWQKYIDMKAYLHGVAVWEYEYTDKDLQYIIQSVPAIDTTEQAEFVLLNYVREMKIGSTVCLVAMIFILLLVVGAIISCFIV